MTFEPGHFRLIHRDDVPLGGFAGIVETRLLMSPRLWPKARSHTNISHGFGDYIYTALGYFKPNDGAPMHPHQDVDIVTLVSSGSVGHKGTVGDGTIIHGPGVQVQRAGTGMTHSEFSDNSDKADFVQMWFLPPEQGLVPSYRNYSIPEDGGLVTVLGGQSGDCFENNMCCRIGFLCEGESVSTNEPSVAIVFAGSGNANGEDIADGDLIEAGGINVSSASGLGLILISPSETDVAR